MSIKKLCLLFTILLIIASGLFVGIYYSGKEEIKQLDTKENNNTENINSEKIIDVVGKTTIEQEAEKPKEVNQEVKKEIVKDKKEVEEKSTKQEIKNNTDNNIPIVEEQAPVVEEKEEIIETPSCTPKKFVWSWVVPEFSSESSCEAKGNTFIPEYGYQCDSYQDDCGDYYYMLRLFDDNQHLIDWHTIEN